MVTMIETGTKSFKLNQALVRKHFASVPNRNLELLAGSSTLNRRNLNMKRGSGPISFHPILLGTKKKPTSFKKKKALVRKHFASVPNRNLKPLAGSSTSNSVRA